MTAYVYARAQIMVVVNVQMIQQYCPVGLTAYMPVGRPA